MAGTVRPDQLDLANERGLSNPSSSECLPFGQVPAIGRERKETSENERERKRTRMRMAKNEMRSSGVGIEFMKPINKSNINQTTWPNCARRDRSEGERGKRWRT